MQTRVRYPPSPTGYQHIGGVRTALFNYLFARAKGGRFILRIEDTDRERYREEALEDIYATFDWLGFHWDEGPDISGPHAPYFQSERAELHRRHADQLVESGHAYPCYCSQERLQQLKEDQARHKQPVGYDRHCRNLSEQEREQFRGPRPVIRFQVPLEGSTTFQDELLGSIETPNRDINPDPVLLKSDGFPTYHLANVVDDHEMKITHVLRAQEWLPSVALHVLLYRAFGWTPPKFCHLPMVLGPDGRKLSKRHGATRIGEFREQGYLPEAIINYVALLGWSFDDSREFFTLPELEELFSLERLNKAPAVFDYRKLDWFNGMYIRRLSPAALQERLLPFLQGAGLVGDPPSTQEARVVEGLVPLVQERLSRLSEVATLARFLFREVEEYDVQTIIPKRLDRLQTIQALKAVLPLLQGFWERPPEENEERFRELAAGLGFKLGDLLMPLRVSLTGSRVSPPLLESIRLLGPEKTGSRVEDALEKLAGVE